MDTDRTVILSPHFDDAVFNCWHAIEHGHATVMTIFAGEPAAGTRRFWDLVCGEADSRRMVRNRQKENAAALMVSGADTRVINLDFLDAQYRSQPLTVEETADEILMKCPAASVFLAPLAASPFRRHADHVLVREAALHMLRQGRRVYFYPDAPYMHLPPVPNDESLQGIRLHASSVLDMNFSLNVAELSADTLKRKRTAMRAYKSQYAMTNIFSFGGLGRIGGRNYELVIDPQQ